MQFLIITGLSGAGKSRVADILEDLDYYCVDNMPVALMPRFAELCIATGGRYEKVALVTDVREKDGFGELLKTLDQLNDMDCGCRILYMDCDIRTLVRRYKESRRPHPLSAPGVTVEDAIRKEEQLLAPIRERADYVINTSNLTLGMLQNRLFSIFVQDGRKRDLDITVMSFGYKHGLPMDADLVFDARFLPNPYWRCGRIGQRACRRRTSRRARGGLPSPSAAPAVGTAVSPSPPRSTTICSLRGWIRPT